MSATFTTEFATTPDFIADFFNRNKGRFPGYTLTNHRRHIELAKVARADIAVNPDESSQLPAPGSDASDHGLPPEKDYDSMLEPMYFAGDEDQTKAGQD